jgi:hypothetical protein
MNQYIEVKEFDRDYSKLTRHTYRLGAAQPLNVVVPKVGGLVAAADPKP